MIGSDGRRWTQGLGLCALTIASAVALRRSSVVVLGVGGDGWSPAAFVAASYALLLALAWCLRAFERAAGAGDEVAMGRLKVAVWLLASALTGMFSARVAPAMPRAAAFLVWSSSAVTVAAGFRLFLGRN